MRGLRVGLRALRRAGRKVFGQRLSHFAPFDCIGQCSPTVHRPTRTAVHRLAITAVHRPVTTAVHRLATTTVHRLATTAWISS